MSFLCACFGTKQSKEAPVDYWDCSRLGLTDLPKEVYKYRGTLLSLYLNKNHIKDLPRVSEGRREGGREDAPAFGGPGPLSHSPLLPSPPSPSPNLPPPP